MLLITQNLIVEFLALLVSILFFKTLNKSRLKSFPFFLAFILIVEVGGSYLRRNLHQNNVWLYNLSIPVEYIYYLFLFWLHGQSLLRTFTKLAAAAILITCVLYLFLLPITFLHTRVLVTGQAMVIFSCCIYIYEVFTGSDEQSLLKNYFYWIVCGLLLFNLGDVIYFIFFPVIHSKQWDRLDTLFGAINRNLLLMLYLSYVVSIFVLRKFKNK